MKIYNGSKQIQLRLKTKSDYPLAGMLCVTILLYMAMLISWVLIYPAFLICIYRIIRYDAKVFSTDYCVLIPMSTLFQTSGGMSLLIYLCLFAAIWYVFRSGIQFNSALCYILILLNYLFLRMQMEVSKMILFFGQMFLLYVLLPRQDLHSSVRAVKAFCVSIFSSSVYALLFRNSSEMIALRGSEVPAFWGSSFMRFQGLFEDPNYYMILVITGLALLLKLRDCRLIRRFSFLAMSISLGCFGLLTYSKTFFLVLVMLAGIYILWQYRNKKVFFATALALLMIAVAFMSLMLEFSPVSVIVTRLISSTGISDLTTRRSDIFARYWEAITQNMGTFLWGYGFAAPRLDRDTHNLYLEIMYYTGTVGLLLVAGFYSSMVHAAQKKTKHYPNQNVFSKYVVLFTVLVVFFSLHGVFSLLMYGVFYLAFLSVLLTRDNEVK